METIRMILCAFFIVAGFVFIVISVVGVIRLPDFYSRLHASGIGETVGLVLCSIGLFIYEGFTVTGMKILLIFAIACLTNPIGTHILGRVSHKSGFRPWEKTKEED